MLKSFTFKDFAYSSHLEIPLFDLLAHALGPYTLCQIPSEVTWFSKVKSKRPIEQALRASKMYLTVWKEKAHLHIALQTQLIMKFYFVFLFCNTEILYFPRRTLGCKNVTSTNSKMYRSKGSLCLQKFATNETNGNDYTDLKKLGSK